MLKCKTQGGKGNEGMFIERDPHGIVAAGIPSGQPNLHVGDHFKQYLLQDQVDALISDAIIPDIKKTPYPRTVAKISVADLINPPLKTKFQNLVDEMKETCYTSYWKKPVGRTHDQTPFLPAGFDINKETFGRKTVFSESAYGVIFPRDTLIRKISPSLDPGHQLNRKYCRPPYNPDQTFGFVQRADPRGVYAKCAFSDDRMKLGTAYFSPRHSREVDIKAETVPELGKCATPNDNINRVPKGYAFGKLKPPDSVRNCLRPCEINPRREVFLKCLGHLNTLRKCMSKLFDDHFFTQCYLHFKYLDKARTGWLPKEVVYNYCISKHVRVNPSMLEPLLEVWRGFDGSQIQYKTFVDTINHRIPLPDIPKIPDVAVECLEFSTTYNDMVRPGQDVGRLRMAGLPSGRYFDKDTVTTSEGMCKADRITLPQESNARSRVSPSVFSHFGVTHRDMYAKRTPEVVRRVFEAAGENFTDQRFNELWDEAKKFHSQGWVCFATFREVLEK